MDLGDRCMYYPFFTDTLAVFYNTYKHKKGIRKHKMGCCGLSYSYYYRNADMLYCCSNCQDFCIIKRPHIEVFFKYNRLFHIQFHIRYLKLVFSNVQDFAMHQIQIRVYCHKAYIFFLLKAVINLA